MQRVVQGVQLGLGTGAETQRTLFVRIWPDIGNRTSWVGVLKAGQNPAIAVVTRACQGLIVTGVWDVFLTSTAYEAPEGAACLARRVAQLKAGGC
eukprot:CAMPEP_0177783080 /NCGR_PEP_ID=MMETSP0491_2-20121128/18878_1 /TAXON_ID=63592 /ORGANISM="Tetraselmis chuii, Strain PLY429" /LENGTH=94 /DNA_ID=CAMNT_0019303559 /DNA_START=179 /DNA_END=463 /DNA_ORIENTATION=+